MSRRQQKTRIYATTNMKENAIDTLGHGKKVIGHRLNQKKNH